MGTGDRCHSPFRYLATAADDVINVARKSPSSSTVYLVKPIVTGEESAPRESGAALNEFETHVEQVQQEKFVTEFIQREYPHGFLSPARVIKSLAAQRWISERQLPTNMAVAN